MVNENEKQEILNKIREQELQGKQSKGSAERIEDLENLLKTKELEAAKEKEELLIKLADKAEENTISRRNERDAIQKAKIAEYKYVNQQKQEINGIVEMGNEETKDPQIRARQIFVERLKARMEKSQRLAEEKKDNTYYI